MMINPSTQYAAINGNEMCVMKASKARCWSEVRRRRRAGDVTAYVMQSTDMKVGQVVKSWTEHITVQS